MRNTRIAPLPTGFHEASHRLITVQVDPASTILELNEQNNEASQVLQVGQPAQSGAAIVVTAGSVLAYQGQTAWVTGQAFYDFTTVPGTSDFPVQGARVTATIFDSGGQSRGVFTGSLSNVSGGFSQIFLAPNEIGAYTLRIEVTDGTVATFITTLDVQESIVPPPSPPSPPSTPGGGPVDDVAVSSEDIIFSEVNPGIGEPITILARLWHIGPTAGIIPVTVNDIFPVAGSLRSFPIGTTTAYLPASSGEWVYVGITLTWTNSADGAHVIQVIAAPEYSQPIGNDQATRLIYVGTAPANLDITKSVELLVDADGNSLVSPGDTLRYTIQYGNTGGTDVTGALILDDYNEALLNSPFGLSIPGAIDGGMITWNLGTIVAGAIGVVTYDVQIKPLGEFPLEVRTISNYAILDTDQTASLAASATIDVVTNRAPIAHAGGPYSIFEGDELTLDASASFDLDGSADVLAFEWDFDGDGQFDDASGVAPTFSAAVLDGPSSHTIRLRVKDSAGAVSNIAIATVNVTNVAPTTPADNNGASNEVLENSPAGTLVGITAASSDPGVLDTVTFSLTDDAGGRFAINSSTGVVTVANGSLLDYEAATSHSITVEASDGQGGTSTQSFTVNLLNQTATITGTVFVDADGDGLFDGGTETAIDAVMIELYGSLGGLLDTDLTELGGVYAFIVDDEYGTYRVREIQPTNLTEGAAILGSAGGQVISSNEMRLTLNGSNASDYDFTEAGQAVQAGDTASIGFWQNKNGQALIKQGGAALVTWLNTNFGNIFGNTFSNGSGGDNAIEVASFYKNEFFNQKLKGTPKVDAQFMATALATFFTSSNLSGGNVAASYGFNVTQIGVGTKVVNVGTSGAAFGVANNTNMTIMSLLLATNDRTGARANSYSNVYDTNGDGVLDNTEKALRVLANTIYSAINEAGHI